MNMRKKKKRKKEVRMSVSDNGKKSDDWPQTDTQENSHFLCSNPLIFLRFYYYRIHFVDLSPMDEQRLTT